MTEGTLDVQTTILIIGAAFALVLLLWLLLGGRRRQSLRSKEQERVEFRVEDPYAAAKDRPYMRDAAPAPAPPTPAVEPPAAAPAQPQPPQPPSAAPVLAGRPEADDDIDVSQPAVPFAGEFGGIAFPPHSTDHPDQLTRLKGVGPKLAAMLNEEGITRFEQLASLDEHEVAALDNKLGNFKGRLARDRVVEQARLLASGATEEYEAKFGKLGG